MNMKAKDYQKEVMEMCPDAYCQCTYFFGAPFFYYIENACTGEAISKKANIEPVDAWQSAYKKLKRKQIAK